MSGVSASSSEVGDRGARSSCPRPAWRVLAPLFFSALWLLASPALAADKHLSDQNRDGEVDLQDLMLFSQNELGQDWQTVDWCQWLAEPHKHDKHLEELLKFINDYFLCDGPPDDPLAVVNANDHPTRLAWSPDGQQLYVSDTQVNSVFIYDDQLAVLAQLKGLAKPLGVAVSALGDICVGNDQRDNVEVYSPEGDRTATIGAGSILMPNDMAFGPDGYLYVADSKSDRVWVIDTAGGAVLDSIGEGALRFPAAVAFAGSELFVADQQEAKVKVFDLQGNLLRSFGGGVTQGSLGYKWQGKFIRLQSLAFDGQGRLHAVDSHMSIIQLLNAANGAYLGYYGSKGSAPGELRLPLDVDINGSGQAAVANRLNKRVELLAVPQ